MWTKYKCVIKQLFEKFLFFDTFKVGLFYKIYQISKFLFVVRCIFSIANFNQLANFERKALCTYPAIKAKD